jgi:hypothetical protein
MRSRQHIAAILIAGALAFGFGRAFAQDDSRGPTPPRLGLVDGDVSFWRPGAEDWAPAQVNTALAEGDELYAGERANVELQIGSRAFVRAGSDTQIGLEALDDDTMQYKVTGGHAAFDLRRLPSAQAIEIDTPRAAFTIDRPGYYRVDVDEGRTAFSARRGGRAHVVAENGEELDVGDGEQLVLANESTAFGVQPAAALDDWDRWNEERTGSFGETPRSANYVSPEVAGVDDLDRYGDWREEPRYGHVWRPRDVGPDWSPYSTGRWQYDPSYEWTWVDDAPWGWAPYHYGRWVYASNYWGWVPGPVIVRPVYAPALVAFFGGPAISVGVSIGSPFVSWCPLGFGEPVIPWWGGSGFVGRPYWGGWGGPRIVNNVVINNTRSFDGRNINRFQNTMVHNAVVGLDRDHFRQGGRPGRLGEARDLRPLHGNLDVRPGARSFMPHEGRGHRPPPQFQNRAVVATRPGRDPIHRLREKGIDVASAPVARPQPRVVHPRGGNANRLAERRQPDATPGAMPPGAGANGHDRRVDRGAGGRSDTGGSAMRHGAFGGPPPRPGRGRDRADMRNDVTPPPPAAASRDHGMRDRTAAPEPPRNRGFGHAAPSGSEPPQNRGLSDAAPLRPEPRRNREFGHAAPSRPEPRAAERIDRGRRDAWVRPSPGPRAPMQDETRATRRATPRPEVQREPTHRMAPEPRAPRVQRNVPHEAVPTPMPRDDRTRFERPRSAPQERSARRSAPAPSVMRERASRGRAPAQEMGHGMRREAPRMERQAERAAPRPRGGRPQGHAREG